MRPAGRGELDSLYFAYRHYPWREAPEQRGGDSAPAVTIVGVGPVGLLSAIVLATHGVRCVLLEAKDHINDGSRATCIAGFNFDTFRQFGADAEFIGTALPWTRGRSYFGTREIYRLEMPFSVHERHHPMYNLQQQYTEQFLINRALALHEHIDLRWSSRVVALRQIEGAVTLTVENPAGTYELTSPYVIAADGGRSSVREMLGLRLAGENFPGRYVIADIRMTMDFPTERRAFFRSPANPDATILIHKQPHDIWRMDWQVAAEDAEAAVREDAVRERIPAILAMLGETGAWELEWWSLYTANTLCLDDYRCGRVFFAGDSAHIVPIFGVRGLNNGLADALDLGWKLAYVLKGRASERLLQSYTPERRGATLDVFENAARSSRFMTPPTPGYRILRQAALELAVSEPFARPFANPRQVRPHRYADSPLFPACSDVSGPVAPGGLLPNLRLGDNHYVFDHLGPGFNILLLGPEPGFAPRLATGLRRIDPHGSVLSLGTAGGDDPVDGCVCLPPPTERELEPRWGVGPRGAIVLRPDRYVLCAGPAAEADALLSAVRTCLAGGPEHEC